jgi:hypothetical protein
MITKKISNIIFYILSSIAFISIVIGFMHNNHLKSGNNNEIENVAMTFYENIDRGNFEKLFDMSIETHWSRNTDNENGGKYVIDGIVKRDDFIKRVIKDFGENGWRIMFTSLNTTGVSKISLDEFKKLYPRENEILKYCTFNKNVKHVYLVDIKGYSLGNCDIADWNKKLPIIWTGDNWKVLLPGSPEDLILHREDWFVNREVKYP